jgi:hypothetical protein
MARAASIKESNNHCARLSRLVPVKSALLLPSVYAAASRTLLEVQKTIDSLKNSWFARSWEMISPDKNGWNWIDTLAGGSNVALRKNGGFSS